ncbi:MAG: thioesterase family protein [Nocardioides sp.]|uniref:thioesterase family protein n=1 Tax=Nocardioides sp. TaxID=35761 RepID=UPI003F0CDB4A
MTTDTACYLPLGSRVDPDGRTVERFRATAHTASAWNLADQHGGPVSGILTRAMERCSPREGTRLSRITVEILGAVPVAEIEVSAWVERPGRRIELVAAEIRATGPDGEPRAVARASAWRLVTHATDEVASSTDSGMGDAPADDAEGQGSAILPKAWRAGFVNALDWHLSELPGPEGGPTGGWLRLRVPLVAGEEPTPTQRVLTIVDVANGVGARLDARHFTFLNTEVSVHLYEPPTGLWVGLRAETSVGRDGIGMSAGSIHDDRGPVGRIAQNVLVERRARPTAGTQPA